MQARRISFEQIYLNWCWTFCFHSMHTEYEIRCCVCVHSKLLTFDAGYKCQSTFGSLFFLFENVVRLMLFDLLNSFDYFPFVDYVLLLLFINYIEVISSDTFSLFRDGSHFDSALYGRLFLLLFSFFFFRMCSCFCICTHTYTLRTTNVNREYGLWKMKITKKYACFSFWCVIKFTCYVLCIRFRTYIECS